MLSSEPDSKFKPTRAFTPENVNAAMKERATDPVADEKSVAWSLKAGGNLLRLRVKVMRGITGPEIAIVMFLADALPAR